ncbi:MAG: hypothetical protein KDA61_12395 [Planctomycetales bacterium]|nr:hypothetical protein [Planctomycetales bacterium]
MSPHHHARRSSSFKQAISHTHRFSFVSPFFARRLRVEELEVRRMLASFLVSSLADEGAGTLREAITMANTAPGADTIDFSVVGKIDVGSQLPTITEAVHITGPGANLLTIDAGDGADNLFDTSDGYRIFEINDATSGLIDVSISGVYLTGGDPFGRGGAIFNTENLVLAGVTLTDNAAQNDGGGIWNDGTTTISRSTISGNVGAVGGGILNGNTGILTIIQSTISGNQGFDGGGINNRGKVVVTQSTLAVNRASRGGGAIWNRGEAAVTQSIISGNRAGTPGGMNTGGDEILSYSSSFNLSGNVLGDSYGSVASAFGGGTVQQAARVNNILATADGSKPTALSAILSPLADNGGTTLTHAITITSPAFQGGDASFTGPPDFDQRGADYHRVAFGRIDIGAYELQALPTLVVDTFVDESDGDFTSEHLSLREAIEIANAFEGHDNITIAVTGRIGIASQLPTITDSVTIIGPGADLLTIDAGLGGDGLRNGNGYRIFNIDDGTSALRDVEISGLAITGGDTPSDGGAIYNQENLTLANSALSGNSADLGGGILNIGSVTISRSTLSDNSASKGGGVLNSGSAIITQSTLSGNQAAFEGGGIQNALEATLTINRGTLSGNSAARGGGVWNFGTADIKQSIISGNTTGAGGEILNYSNYFYIGRVNLNAFNLIGDSSQTTEEALRGVAPGVEDILATSDGNEPTPLHAILGPLANNGGPTLTHALAPNSPALDAGTGSVIAGLLFNTGVDQLGIALSDGVDDPHYALLTQPGGGSLFDQTTPADGFPIPPWLANDSSSRWIGPLANDAEGPPGDYLYRTTFDLSSLEFSEWSFEIIGVWASDNAGVDILINGVSTGQTNQQFIEYSSFTVAAGFVPGLNTLDFVVNNASDTPNPTGLRVHDVRLVVTPTTDQRGLARNVNGVDIGAYEAQAAPSADFDSDGDVDGADFLTWQRGFGTLSAAKMDGDADNDADVDADDLAVWQTQFGSEPPLASKLQADSVAEAPVSGQSSSADLIDAAMALAWMDLPPERESLFVAQVESSAETMATSAVTEPVAYAVSAAQVDSALPQLGGRTATEMGWLAEELLEKLVG